MSRAVAMLLGHHNRQVGSPDPDVRVVRVLEVLLRLVVVVQFEIAEAEVLLGMGRFLGAPRAMVARIAIWSPTRTSS